MNVVIFGASGRTGHELIQQGLKQGHRMTAFVRNPAKLQVEHVNLQIRKGDVVERKSVECAVAGQDAAICALGPSTLLKRNAALIVGMHNILIAMEQARVVRFVYLSADIVQEVRQDLNFLGRYLIAPIMLRNVAADHEVNEAMIKQSCLDWIIVRPPLLTNGRRTSVYRSGEHLLAKALIPQVSRADLAEFMLRQLMDETFVCKSPTVMY